MILPLTLQDFEATGTLPRLTLLSLINFSPGITESQMGTALPFSYATVNTHLRSLVEQSLVSYTQENHISPRNYTVTPTGSSLLTRWIEFMEGGV